MLIIMRKKYAGLVEIEMGKLTSMKPVNPVHPTIVGITSAPTKKPLIGSFVLSMAQDMPGRMENILTNTISIIILNVDMITPF